MGVPFTGNFFVVSAGTAVSRGSLPPPITGLQFNAEKDALDPVANAMVEKNEDGEEYVRVCRSIQ